MEDTICNLTRLPIIYTTRLEDMKIFRKDAGRRTFENLIETINFESKPCYTDTQDKLYISKINKAKKIFFAKLKLKGNDKVSRNRGFIYRYSTSNGHSRLRRIKNEVSTEEVRLEVEKRSNSVEVVKPEKVLVPELQINHLKLRNLLALCKPLRIILTDIVKYAPIKDKENEINHLSIINVDNDYKNHRTVRDKDTQSETEIKSQSLFEFVNCEDIITPSRTLRQVDAPRNHLIKNVSNLKNILESDDIKNSTIVFYNIFAKEVDTYKIDENYNVTDFLRKEYTQICKFEMRHCNLIINILVCCWKSRHSYITLLLSYKDKYAIIAHCMHRQHPCEVWNCKCCCSLTEGNSIEPLIGYNNVSSINNDPSKVITNISSNLSSSSSDTQSSKIILNALSYPIRPIKEGKCCQRRQPFFVKYNKNNYKHECKSLMTLRRNNSLELYELGPEFVVYSKVLNEALDDSKWISKTLNSGQPEIRYKNSPRIENSIAFSSYFNRPLSQENVRKRSKKQLKCFDLQTECKVEHLRRFIRNKNVETKIESILPYIHSSGSLVSNNVLTIEQEKQIGEELSLEVKVLINDILNRFRDVRLTINAEGKVVATLNAPSSSLSAPELKVLSEIVTRAQDQVNKLSLIPETCLNLDMPTLTTRNSVNSGLNPTNTHVNRLESNDHTSREVKIKRKKTKVSEKKVTKTSNINYSQDISKNNNLGIASGTTNKNVQFEILNDPTAEKKILSDFSRIISEKKLNYEESFRGYLGDTSLLIPKITKVFSLNSSTHSNISKDHVDDTWSITESNLKTSNDLLIKPIVSKETYFEMNKQDKNVNNTEINKTKVAKGRKHKTSSESGNVPTKIKVKINMRSLESRCQPSS